MLICESTEAWKRGEQCNMMWCLTSSQRANKTVRRWPRHLLNFMYVLGFRGAVPGLLKVPLVTRRTHSSFTSPPLKLGPQPSRRGGANHPPLMGTCDCGLACNSLASNCFNHTQEEGTHLCPCKVRSGPRRDVRWMRCSILRFDIVAPIWGKMVYRSLIIQT